ncbi:hypothetical protein V2J09_001193 [Rumex salicifolius]
MLKHLLCFRARNPFSLLPISTTLAFGLRREKVVRSEEREGHCSVVHLSSYFLSLETLISIFAYFSGFSEFDPKSVITRSLGKPKKSAIGIEIKYWT